MRNTVFADRSFTGVLRAGITAIALGALSACGGGGGGNNPTQVNGTAKSVINGQIQASRDFIVNNLETGEQVADGTTDSTGQYEFEFLGTNLVMVVVFPPEQDTGEPRTSGLVFLSESTNTKDLEDFTDIACVAGSQAVGDNSITAQQLSAQRIANLEAAAQQYLASNVVDFTNTDSFNAAVAAVRQSTNDGANAPS